MSGIGISGKKGDRKGASYLAWGVTLCVMPSSFTKAVFSSYCANAVESLGLILAKRVYCLSERIE